jgi:eukaryotic-like serine/threonine-protein kinase
VRRERAYDDDVRASSDGEASDRTATTSEGRAAPQETAIAAPIDGAWIGEHLEIVGPIDEEDDRVLVLARDVRLDRLVEVELCRGDDEALARREREVRALAKLSDPNVAAIHEVGRDRGRLFVAIEHVDGTSARTWLSAAARSVDEIVAVWLAAARGLVAAHAAGLVHGAFDADRIVLATRVCVIGFSGRAATQDGRIADRHAWCAGLREALRDERVPGWLRRLLADAAQRDVEPSMARIVAIVARPNRARRWLALGLGTAAAAGIVGVVLGSRPAPCNDGAARMAAIWSDERRTAIEATFVAAAGEQGKNAWVHADRTLDDWAQRWIELRASSCHATRTDGTQSEAVLERSMGCFDRRAAELGALLDAFAEIEAPAIARAPEAASTLPTPVACTDASYLLAKIAPPSDESAATAVEAVRDQLRQVEALRRTNRVPAANAAAEGLRERAEATGYEPVRGEALVELARLAFAGAHDAEGRELMHEAVLAGRKSGDAAITAEASARLASDYARNDDREQAESWLALAQLELDRKVADPELEIDVLRTRAFLLDRYGDTEAGIEQFRLALARVIALHGDRWRAAAVRNDIAIAMASGNRREEAVPVFTEVIDAIEREIGPDTPQAAIAHANLGQLLLQIDRLEEGEAHLRTAIAVLEKIHGPDSPTLYHATVQLGLALSYQHRCAEAKPVLERAVKLGEARSGPDSPEVGVAIGSLSVCSQHTGDLALSLEQSRRSAAILAKHFGPEHRDVVAARVQAVLTLIDLGRRDEAEVELRSMIDSCARTHACPASVEARIWSGIAYVELRRDDPAAASTSAKRGIALGLQGDARGATLAELRCTLAEALVVTGGDREEIRELVQLAVPVVREYSPEEAEHCAKLGA